MRRRQAFVGDSSTGGLSGAVIRRFLLDGGVQIRVLGGPELLECTPHRSCELEVILRPPPPLDRVHYGVAYSVQPIEVARQIPSIGSVLLGHSRLKQLPVLGDDLRQFDKRSVLKRRI